MTTLGFNTEELKRKLDVDESQSGPIQKILKRSEQQQISDIFSQTFDFEDQDDDFDMDSEFNDSEDSSNKLHHEQQLEQQEEQQKTQQPAPPQRKKPGRKPNPASPALRKAQNRAAQRAFRERKERHLRELENTIKTLREDQYESLIKHQRETSHYQRETSHYRSLIEHLEAENSFLKQVAFTFECALNNINGNNDATTKLKNAVSLNARSLPLNGNNSIIGSINSSYGLGTMQMRQAVTLPSQQSVPTAQQLQNTLLGLFQSQPDVNVNGRGANLSIPSPATSNVMMSPNSANMSTATVSAASTPPTPESIIPDSFPPSSTFFAEEFAREITLADMKPFVTSSPIPLFVDNTYNSSDPSIFKTGIDPTSSQLMSKSNSNSSTISTVSSGSDTTNLNNNNNNSSFMAEAASMIDNEADFFSAMVFNDDLGTVDEESKNLFLNFDFNNTNNNEFDVTKKRLSRDSEQLLRLSKKVGQAYPAPVFPKTRYPLTHQQKYYLTLEHDARIAMIPCLHLRSRMIQYRDQYDLYELVELLINKAKCHGDPIDPDAWELPEEFFERYGVLVFQHCRIKSSLYKKYGRLPKDFDNFYRKGSHLIS